MRDLTTSLCLLALVAGLAPGCVPTDFEDRRGEASTRAVEPPEDYPNTRFGTVVEGYGGTLAGMFGSRIASSAGGDTPFTVYPLLIGDELRLDTPLIDGCDTETPCDAGSGASLVGMPTFRGRSMCLAVASPETGTIKASCEDDAATPLSVPGVTGERFGAAGAGLRESHAFGAALYGAPGANGGAGGVYRLGEAGAPSPLDLSMGMGPGRELGLAVAIGIVDADTVLIAAGAPRGSDKRVIAATVDIDTGGAATTSVRGCFDATTRGFGEALAIGDWDNDGMQDIAVGSGVGQGADLRENVVRIYWGSAMGAPDSCVGAWAEGAQLTCPTEFEGIECGESSNFGAALDVGDIDGDGIDDLIVGTPNATVDGESSAGAVFIFTGTNMMPAAFGMTRAVAAHSSPSTNASVGAAVTSAPGQAGATGRRDEVVAGAPGQNRVYVFLCTGLVGDTASEFNGTRCQPLDN